MVKLRDQKDIIQSELRNGKKKPQNLLNPSPNEMAPAKFKKLKVKVQHNPNTLPKVNSASFRFKEPCKKNITDTKRALNITSVAVDWYSMEER